MTTGPGEQRMPAGPGGGRDRIAVPLSFLLWALVVIALAYGVISTLQKATQLFGG